MFQYKCLNPISQTGLGLFGEEYKQTEDLNNADAVLVRSAKMHDMELPENVKVIARAGAGVNNIPVDACAEKGIVVFNTPGANANGVKELVLAGMLLASRDIVGGIELGSTVKKIKNISTNWLKNRKNSLQDARSAVKSLVSSVSVQSEPWLQTLQHILVWKFTDMTLLSPLMQRGTFPEPSNTANLWMRSTASAITSPSMYRLLIILAR